MRKKTAPNPASILARISKTPTCWIWTGHVDRCGYGTYLGRTAQRQAYELFVGPIPDGLQIDHLCRNTLCVNPDHLEPVTPAENTRRAHAHITHCPQGHPYEGANVYRRGNRRYCRSCNREAARRYAERKRQEKAA